MVKGVRVTLFLRAKYLLCAINIFSFSSFSQEFEDFRSTNKLDKKITIAEALAYHYVKDNLDSLLLLGHELLKHSNHNKNELGVFSAKRIIGTYKIRTSQIEDGLNLLRSSKNYFLANGNFTSATEVCNEIGNGYQYSGKIDEAIKWYQESIKYGKIAPDENIKNIALINLAQAFILKSDFEKAESAALQYCEWVLSTQAIDATSNAYAVLGNIELKTNNFDEAITYFQYSANFAHKSGSKTQLAHAYTNLGISSFYTGEKEKSVYYFIQALDLNKSIQNVKSICDSYLNLGGVYFELSENENANKFYYEGLDVARNAKIYSSQIELLEAIIELRNEEKKSTFQLESELKLAVDLQNNHVTARNKVDRELEKDLVASKYIQNKPFQQENSQMPFYIGSGIIFLVFILLALRKKLV